MAKRKNSSDSCVNVPSLEVFKEMVDEWKNGSISYRQLLKKYNIEEYTDFDLWWNNYYGENDVDDFMLRYSKLGKLLREGENV